MGDPPTRVSFSEAGVQWRYLLASETDIAQAKGSWAALKAATQ